jgi:hypothetical protein
LQRSDWAGFWRELGVRVSDADRQLMELSDPRAMAAVQLARERSTYDLDPALVRAPTLLYYGSDDLGSPVDAAAAAFGVESRILPGTTTPGGFATTVFSPLSSSSSTRSAIDATHPERIDPGASPRRSGTATTLAAYFLRG